MMLCGCGAEMELVSETAARCSAGCAVYDEWSNLSHDQLAAILERSPKASPECGSSKADSEKT